MINEAFCSDHVRLHHKLQGDTLRGELDKFTKCTFSALIFKTSPSMTKSPPKESWKQQSLSHQEAGHNAATPRSLLDKHFLQALPCCAGRKTVVRTRVKPEVKTCCNERFASRLQLDRIDGTRHLDNYQILNGNKTVNGFEKMLTHKLNNSHSTRQHQFRLV